MTRNANCIKRERAPVAYHDRYRHCVRRGSARDTVNRKRIRTARTPLNAARKVIEELSVPKNHAVTTVRPSLKDLELMILPDQPMDPTQRRLFEKIAARVELGTLSWSELKSWVVAWYQIDASDGRRWVGIKPPKRP